MNLETSLRISSLLLVTSAFVGLTLATTMPLALVLLAFLALAVNLIHAMGWGLNWLVTQLSRVSTTVWNSLMIVAFIACAVDMIWLSQDVLLSGINFLIVLMINKLFNLQQRKDYLYLYAMSLLQLLATAALTVEPWYALVFIAYLLSAIWTLLLYHLRNEAEEIRLSGGPLVAHAASPITRRFFWTTNLIAVAALLITLAIFFITPRAGAGFFHKSRGQLIRTSGFSQTVDLGVIGNIKLDPTVVMRVQFPEQKTPTDERIYLQGAAFDHYTGRSWVNSLSRRQVMGQTQAGAFLVPQTAIPRHALSAIQQDILIEALDAPVLFGIPVMRSIKGNFLLLQADAIGGIHLPYLPSRRFQYSVLSVPNRLRPKDRTVSAFTYPDHIAPQYLQLPPLSPEVAALAHEVTKDAETPYDKAVALKWHLLGNYKYSLDVGDSMPASPLEEFLFVRKTGYCEHYATAMTLMLRTQGIPARLVTGFLASEWNDFGQYYTVRQRDAHAWVEVFFPHSGWVIFDPTPSLGSAPATSPAAILARLVDSFRLKWTRFVIQYSFKDQQTVLQELRDRSRPVQSRISTMVTVSLKWMRNWRLWFLSHTQHWDWRRVGMWVGGLIIAIALLLVLSRNARRWIFQKAAPHSMTEQVAATRLYRRMLRALETYGVTKPPSTAPIEFTGVISAQWADAGAIVRPLTELYCRSRFGTRPLSSEDLRRADTLLAKLGALARGPQDGSTGPTDLGAGNWTAPWSWLWQKMFKE